MVVKGGGVVFMEQEWGGICKRGYGGVLGATWLVMCVIMGWRCL